jgi:hypothetical protein
VDPTLTQVLVGLVTNAFGAVVEKSWASATSIDLEEVVRTAVGELADDPDGAPRGSEEAVEFLLSPEATALVRLLFVSQVHRSGATGDQLQATFVDLCRRSAPAVTKDEARALFGLVAAASASIVEEAARGGDAEAGEVMQNIRFRRLTEEVQGVARAVEALAQTGEEDVQAYLDWEEIYRNQVRVRHGTITPPSFDAAARVPVDDIYIETRFRLPDRSDAEGFSLWRDEVVERLDRTVVLGDPGAGKSTFAMKLAYDLAGGDASLPGGALTPFLVTLKDYGAEKAANRFSLVEWIESVVGTDYTAPAPPGAIAYLLAAGRAVLILDGLDELLDTSYRREITADVETFAARYVATPILVTSRRIGYSKAPLDPRRFDVAHLSELEDDQIRQYVDMWFGLRVEMPPREREEMAENFMRDSSDAAADLRSNTLMLALLCNIYRGDGYIPRQRPQVYEKCAVMLFERWDRGRRIEVSLEFERHLRPAMQHLAFWIYSKPSLRNGVTEDQLIRSTTDYLLGRRFDDADAARQEARRFVEFCRGRAWVFTDTGTTAEGDGLYQFAHRTFLEFFTAEHLVRTNATPADLGQVLRPRILKGEWDVVSELAFQLQDDNLEGAADELLADLLATEGGVEDQSAALSFAARSLSFLVPTRATCRAVAKAVSRQAYRWLISLPELRAQNARWAYGDRVDSASPPAAFRELMNLNRENFDPVAETVMEEMVAAVQDTKSLTGAEAALEVGPNADMAINPGSPVFEKLETAGKEAFERMWPQLEPHLQTSDRIVYDGVYFNLLGIEKAVEARSVDSLFHVCRFDLYGNLRASLAETLLWGALGKETRIARQPLGTRAELEQLGLALFAAKPPWDPATVAQMELQENFETGALAPRDPDLEEHALFGAFALAANVSEHLGDASALRPMLTGFRATTGWPRLLAPWIELRHGLKQEEPPSPLPMSRELHRQVETWSEHHWSTTARGSYRPPR